LNFFSPPFQTFKPKSSSDFQTIIANFKLHDPQLKLFLKLFFQMPPVFIDIALLSMSTILMDTGQQLPIRVCFSHVKEVVESYFRNPFLSHLSSHLAKETSSDQFGLLVLWRRRMSMLANPTNARVDGSSVFVTSFLSDLAVSVANGKELLNRFLAMKDWVFSDPAPPSLPVVDFRAILEPYGINPDINLSALIANLGNQTRCVTDRLITQVRLFSQYFPSHIYKLLSPNMQTHVALIFSFIIDFGGLDFLLLKFESVGQYPEEFDQADIGPCFSCQIGSRIFPGLTRIALTILRHIKWSPAPPQLFSELPLGVWAEVLKTKLQSVIEAENDAPQFKYDMQQLLAQALGCSVKTIQDTGRPECTFWACNDAEFNGLAALDTTGITLSQSLFLLFNAVSTGKITDMPLLKQQQTLLDIFFAQLKSKLIKHGTVLTPVERMEIQLIFSMLPSDLDLRKCVDLERYEAKDKNSEDTFTSTDDFDTLKDYITGQASSSLSIQKALSRLWLSRGGLQIAHLLSAQIDIILPGFNKNCEAAISDANIEKEQFCLSRLIQIKMCKRHGCPQVSSRLFTPVDIQEFKSLIRKDLDSCRAMELDDLVCFDCEFKTT